MRTARALDFAAIALVAGTALAYAADARQRQFRRARKVTDPPTLRMIAERVY